MPEHRLPIRTIRVCFAASVSLFLAGFARFSVQFRNQKIDQFQKRNVEMFIFRTPSVVFPVCFLLYHLCLSAFTRCGVWYRIGMAAFCNGKQFPNIATNISLETLAFSLLACNNMHTKIPAPIPGLNPFWGVASFLHNPSTDTRFSQENRVFCSKTAPKIAFFLHFAFKT